MTATAARTPDPAEPTPLPGPPLQPRFVAVRSIVALMLREMASTYGNSPGGYLWAILQPVGMLVLLSVAFSLLVRAPALGTSFILFYATGFLPFDMYGDIAGKIAGALNYSRALLSYPRVSWIDPILARLLLNFLTLLMVFCIVITGIMLTDDTHTTIHMVPVIQGLVMSALLGLGVGLCNGVLGGLFPVWSMIWSILSRPLFLASGIFFTYESLPRFVQDILWWNPLIHVTGLVRRGFYSTYDGTYISMTYGYGVALVLILLGLIFMRAHYKRVLER
ncbi:ABC transporter permease [Loktanella sp. M215]|uniref:ABC transporter permease n=1 Tax=Loktanella sp. M215 TaxID=2675431 RepID=UPI001EFFC207|nr:ABC transporter permease [Loktanella sp. M215]MCF7702160.1 sugar ABC transporter permease [Loktanella sp. M215]